MKIFKISEKSHRERVQHRGLTKKSQCMNNWKFLKNNNGTELIFKPIIQEELPKMKNVQVEVDPDWPISRHILVEALDVKYKEENKLLRVSRKKVKSG